MIIFFLVTDINYMFRTISYTAYILRYFTRNYGNNVLSDYFYIIIWKKILTIRLLLTRTLFIFKKRKTIKNININVCALLVLSHIRLLQSSLNNQYTLIDSFLILTLFLHNNMIYKTD